MALAVKMGSWIALEKAMTSLSWAKTVQMGLLVDQGAFMATWFCIKFNSSDDIVGFPEAVQKLKADRVALANGVIEHGFDLQKRYSSNKLVVEGLTGLLVEMVGFLLDKVLAIEFGDFGVSGASWMVGLYAWVGRNIKMSAGDGEVGVGQNNLGKATMASVAAMGMDGGSM
jgi:hypothetical protein